MTTPPQPATSDRLDALFLASLSKLTSVQPGERVLDLRAGDGDAILDAARRSGTEGEQLALDSDPRRLQELHRTAQVEGMTALRVEESDARALPSRDAYWDVVICHLAFPHLAEPETTLKETLRVLRPVGRIGISSWGERARCPLITIFLDAIAPVVPAARDLDHALFRYAEPGKLAVTLAEAGFQDATPERLTEWPVFRDVEDYWSALSSDNRFAPLVAALDAEQTAAAKATIEAKTRFYRRPSGLEIKVEGIVLAAVK